MRTLSKTFEQVTKEHFIEPFETTTWGGNATSSTQFVTDTRTLFLVSAVKPGLRTLLQLPRDDNRVATHERMLKLWDDTESATEILLETDQYGIGEHGYSAAVRLDNGAWLDVGRLALVHFATRYDRMTGTADAVSPVVFWNDTEAVAILMPMNPEMIVKIHTRIERS